MTPRGSCGSCCGHDEEEAHVRRRRWRRRLTVPTAVVLALLVPVAALAGARFADVSPGNTHVSGIGWVADKGITLGCNSDGTLFCPSNPVTRAQMATFMQRFAGAMAPKVTSGQFTSSHTTNPASNNTFVLAGDLGTFTKEQADTRIEVVFHTTATISDNRRCNYQLRVGGSNADGSNATTGAARNDGYQLTVANVDTAAILVPLTFNVDFGQLSAGTHTLQLWVDRDFGSGTCPHNATAGRRAWRVTETP